MEFKSRKEIKESQQTPNIKMDVDYSYLLEQIKNIDVDNTDFSNYSDTPIYKEIEKSKSYFWIRVYLSEEVDITPGDDITIKYVNSGEKLNTKYVCFSKKNIISNEININKYDSEDDTKVLCLMVDEDKINHHSDDIPFIRKLFRNSRYFDYELFKTNDLILTIDRTSLQLKYYMIDL